MSTLGSRLEKNQKSISEKRDRMGEEARETRNEAQVLENPNGVEGHNPYKPKTTLIPNVILEDPQTQLFLDQMKMQTLICKFMGLLPTERTLCSLIKYHWKQSGEVELHFGSKGFFTAVFMNLEDKDKVFGGGGCILPCLNRTVHAAMEGNILPRERNLEECTRLAATLLSVARLLATLDLRSNQEQTWKICEDIGSNTKREIYLLCKDLHRDESFWGTPRSHNPGIRG
jgi:hypothetical protein